MSGFVAAVLLVVSQFAEAAPPMRITIDCPSSDNVFPNFRTRSSWKSETGPRLDVASFCDLINTAIPKAVEDGRFVLVEDRNSEMDVLADTFAPISVLPPKSFIPKFKKNVRPRLNIPRIKVPALVAHKKPLLAPRIGSPMLFARFRENQEEESSAEKMEKFKKVVQKLLHVVKVMGKVDQYISDRTRIIVDKLSKTLAE